MTVNDTAPLFADRVDASGAKRPKLLFLVTEDWYFWSHRMPVARAARDAQWMSIPPFTSSVTPVR